MHTSYSILVLDLIRSLSWPTRRKRQLYLLLLATACSNNASGAHWTWIRSQHWSNIRIVACWLLQHFVGKCAESGHWQVATGTECCCSCGPHYSQVRPRFVAASVLRASLARCAGKISVWTRRRNVQLSARPSTAVTHRHLHANIRRISTALSSIRYSASLGGSAMPAQHTRSTDLLCGRPVALEFSTWQLERSGSWQWQLQTPFEDACIYTVLRIRDVSGRYALQIDSLTC